MNHMHPRAIVFDLDNTLATSKQPIDEPMAAAMGSLLARLSVAVISGGSLEQLQSQAASKLPPDARCSNLFLLPTSGAALYIRKGDDWEMVYEELLSDDEASVIEGALRKGAQTTGLIDFSHELHGPYIENRGAQVSLSALGQQAPISEKEAWDPDHTKREALRAAVAPLLPDFDVKIGGRTTIDVTKHGITKAYGVRKLAEHLGIAVADMLYVGDELRLGGNDEVVKETGIPTKSVSGPADTLDFIEAFLVENGE